MPFSFMSSLCVPVSATTPKEQKIIHTVTISQLKSFSFIVPISMNDGPPLYVSVGTCCHVEESWNQFPPASRQLWHRGFQEKSLKVKEGVVKWSEIKWSDVMWCEVKLSQVHKYKGQLSSEVKQHHRLWCRPCALNIFFSIKFTVDLRRPDRSTSTSKSSELKCLI